MPESNSIMGLLALAVSNKAVILPLTSSDVFITDV
jgi:hypothetical protein